MFEPEALRARVIEEFGFEKFTKTLREILKEQFSERLNSEGLREQAAEKLNWPPCWPSSPHRGRLQKSFVAGSWLYVSHV